MSLSKRFVVVCAILTVPLLALGMPDSQLDDHPVTFGSMDEAAIAALRFAASKTMHLEYGGCVLTNGKEFYYTNPETIGSTDEFAVACLVPSSLTLAAIYHTHPLGTQIQGISPNDLRMAKDLDRPSYVASLELNNVVKFVPGITRVVRLHQGSSSQISHGDLVEPNFLTRP